MSVGSDNAHLLEKPRGERGEEEASGDGDGDHIEGDSEDEELVEIQTVGQLGWHGWVSERMNSCECCLCAVWCGVVLCCVYGAQVRLSTIPTGPFSLSDVPPTWKMER